MPEYPDRNYIERTLAEWEAHYDPNTQQVTEILVSPGYHTRIPDGEIVRSTRTNLYYAVLLLQGGGKERQERAAAIIRRILALQDTDPVSRTYGIWPWFYEEPLDQMSPPDWNWADFCGAALGHVLIEHSHQIDASLLGQIRTALGHAAWSIFRRNVGPAYTNIAIMGSGVTALAGEILTEPRLIDYGRRRLQAFVDFTHFHGDFNEYNSPTYTLVALFELERILQLVHDPQMRANAEAMRRMAWQVIAGHFHPGTAQWAGPHSRAYADLLDADQAGYLSAMTGIPIPLHSRAGSSNEIQLMRPLPCPPDLVDQFRALPESEVSSVQSFNRRKDGSVLVQGTTWMVEDACLGSINRDSLWTQRRPLLAYWRTEDDPAVVLRLRFLKGGRDFATPYLVTTQNKNRALTAVGLADKMGDYHLYLDHPSDGVFEARDMRLRCVISGHGSSVRELEPGIFELAAGGWRGVIHTAAGHFGPNAVRWQSGCGEDSAWVDAVCWSEQNVSFNLKDYSQVVLCAGLELLRMDTPYAHAPLAIDAANGIVNAQWKPDGENLAVELPLGVGPSLVNI